MARGVEERRAASRTTPNVKQRRSFVCFERLGSRRGGLAAKNPRVRRDSTIDSSRASLVSARLRPAPALCLGAHLMMSSTRMIISAASVPESKICRFTRKHSVTPRVAMSPVSPVSTSTPIVVFPSACAARRRLTISLESSPAFSQMIVGIWRSAFANPSIAIERFPGVLAASSSTALAMTISGAPPPLTTRLSRTVLVRTHRASCRERSASPRTWLEAPRRTIVHASPLATPRT